ncbi:MAG: class II fumarate hydratase, partial [Ketobacteraceae bacterium]|nr:class II fumarate hydratase [Ketobacteraceae bacterium]
MSKTRTEKDSMGEIQVPANALYGAQTQRAIQNFDIGQQTMPVEFVRALIHIKGAAARANARLGCLPAPIAAAIGYACDSLLEDQQLMTHFPVDVYQTGSGTSTNMNANEVIARLASDKLGDEVNPNDHVNFGQSSNDVIPSTIHVSASLAVTQQLIPALNDLRFVIDDKASSLQDICKTGRTHLMDALPIRMDQALSAWSAQVARNLAQLHDLQSATHQLALGGTAIGTGLNSHPEFAREVCQCLSETTGSLFKPAENPFALISSQDTAVALSGALKTCAVSLMKIANDLRWMNSGPLAGLGEIQLKALQPGSSIMPGKVNPVIPEAVAMAAAQVMGNDTTIGIAGQSGNFELNVMLPVIARNLLDSIGLLSRSARSLGDQAIASFTVNEDKLNEALSLNPILVTALNPLIGYQKAAE